jgi:hypothetical protein
MGVLIDLVDGSALTWRKDGAEKIRVAHVNSVSGTDAEREYDALTTNGIPEHGDALGASGLLARLKVVELAARCVDADKVSVTIRYATEEPAGANPAGGEDEAVAYRVATSSVEVTTEVNRQGTQITVTHNSVTQGAQVAVTNAESVLEVSRTETNITPGEITQAYANHVNSVPWQGGLAGEWKCVEVDGTSNDGGETWKMTYRFQKRAGGWSPRAVFVDPETGQPPAALVADVGIVTVDWYPTANFAGLGL